MGAVPSIQTNLNQIQNVALAKPFTPVEIYRPTSDIKSYNPELYVNDGKGLANEIFITFVLNRFEHLPQDIIRFIIHVIIKFLPRKTLEWDNVQTESNQYIKSFQLSNYKKTLYFEGKPRPALKQFIEGGNELGIISSIVKERICKDEIIELKLVLDSVSPSSELKHKHTFFGIGVCDADAYKDLRASGHSGFSHLSTLIFALADGDYDLCNENSGQWWARKNIWPEGVMYPKERVVNKGYVLGEVIKIRVDMSTLTKKGKLRLEAYMSIEEAVMSFLLLVLFFLNGKM
jgi:hypothetical protein